MTALLEDRVAAFVSDHPGHTADEIALALRTRRASVLGVLKRSGMFAHQDGPRGSKVYSLAAGRTGRAGNGSTHKQRVLALLQDGQPHSHMEGYRLGVMLHSRVADLRRDGYRIECWRDGGDYLYQLRLLETATGDQSSDDAAAAVEVDPAPVAVSSCRGALNQRRFGTGTPAAQSDGPVGVGRAGVSQGGRMTSSLFPLRPLLLDVFSGAGGCTAGYERAGFRCIGVDIDPQPNYCGGEFIQADALRILEMVAEGYEEWDSVVAIHASPPCQAYTTMNNRHGSSSPALIADVRDLLDATGLPYVIENVAGARSELRHPVRLTGEMFGLAVHLPRLFEVNWPMMAVPAPPRQRDPIAVYGKNDQRRLWTRADGSELRAATLEAAQEAMGIAWMNWDEIREAVPPAYTEFVGYQLAAYLMTKEAVECLT